MFFKFCVNILTQNLKSTTVLQLYLFYRSIYLANYLFQIFAVIFMPKATEVKVALNFLMKTSSSYKAKILSTHFLKCWKPDRNLQSNIVILLFKKVKEIVLTLIRLGCLKEFFLKGWGWGQRDPPFSSDFKKNLSNINIVLYNC